MIKVPVIATVAWIVIAFVFAATSDYREQILVAALSPIPLLWGGVWLIADAARRRPK